MKRQSLSKYLNSMGGTFLRVDITALDKSKKYGEVALKKLHDLSYTPFEEYSLYCQLGLVYYFLTEYSRSLDILYKAYSVALKHNLDPIYVAYVSRLMGNNFMSIGNIDQALNHLTRVTQYYDKYGPDTEVMSKIRYILHLLEIATCYTHQDKTDEAADIFDKVDSLLDKKYVSDDKVSIAYEHFKGEYLIAIKKYDEARRHFEGCVAIAERYNYQRGKLEALSHIGVICILENKLDEAIDTLQSLYRDARKLKINSIICEAALLLSRCYYLKNMPDKAAAIEQGIKNVIAKLDNTWIYEKMREFRRLKPEVGHARTIVNAPQILSRTAENLSKTSFCSNIIIGQSEAMQEVYRLVEKVGPTDLPVLIQGETGTGKELVARAIHMCSARRNTVHVAFNCAALTETLLEGELFGYCKGAFTGAERDKKGYIELASDSTLFIDEIANMPEKMQQKLLRVLEEKCVWRIGSEKPIPVNTRFVFASNQNVEQLVQRKLFRDDLFYRINAVVINLPPLRKRKDDIPLLVNYFIRKYSVNERPIEMDPAVLDVLVNYRWPGNVRELENEIKRICIFYGDVPVVKKLMISETILNYNMSIHKLSVGKGLTIKRLRDTTERDYIIEVLQKCNGNVSEAARQLGYQRPALYKRMKQLQIRNPVI